MIQDLCYGSHCHPLEKFLGEDGLTKGAYSNISMWTRFVYYHYIEGRLPSETTNEQLRDLMSLNEHGGADERRRVSLIVKFINCQLPFTTHPKVIELDIPVYH